MLGLYHDYRSETYNRDRISVEPSYGPIAKDVGSHHVEIKNRNAGLDKFLRRNAEHFSGGTMIDYGGSDGRLIPLFAYETFEEIEIYDASEAPLHGSVDVRRVQKIAAPRLETYTPVTCMHVLEHVGNPKALASEAVRLLSPGGLLYIEVPHDLTRSVLEDFAQRIIDSPIGIHEHMNTFDSMSIRGLIGSIPGLDLIDDAEEIVDFGWAKALIGRFLARKTA
ncbi:MAG: class I SAM-dependent methyltransferase [Acidobacteriota bacterium]